MYKIIAVKTETPSLSSPLSKRESQELSDAIQGALIDASPYDIAACFNDLLVDKDLSHLPESIREVIQSFQMQEQLANTYKSTTFSDATDAALTLFIKDIWPGFLRDQLHSQSDSFSSHHLQQLASRLGVRVTRSHFFRVRIQNGKVNWKLCTAEAQDCFAPTQPKMKAQQVLGKVEAVPGADDYVDLTEEEFLRFKQAGKRHASEKQTRVGDGPDAIIVNRARPERRAEIVQLWDVAQYQNVRELVGEEIDGNRLNRDHIPQDKWVYHTLVNPLWNVAHQINEMHRADRVLSAGVLKKLLGKFSLKLTEIQQLLPNWAPHLLSDTKLLESVFVDLPSDYPLKLKGTLCAAINAEWKKLTEGRAEAVGLALKQNHVVVPLLTQRVVEDLSKNSGWTIAVLESHHIASRTYSLKGKVTTARLQSTVQEEIRLDISDYFKHAEVKDSLEAIGAFRYLARRDVKWFGLADVSDLDSFLMARLKDWKRAHNPARRLVFASL